MAVPREGICKHCGKLTKFSRSTLADQRIASFYGYNPKRIPLDRVNNGDFEWYCNICVRNDRVLVGNRDKQTTVGYLCWEWDPIIYYVDEIRKCKTCKEDYYFYAVEQKKWYEEYGIFTDVAPKMCLKCRRDSRFRGKISVELKSLLTEMKKAPTKEGLRKIYELYLELGNTQKAGEFRARYNQL